MAPSPLEEQVSVDISQPLHNAFMSESAEHSNDSNKEVDMHMQTVDFITMATEVAANIMPEIQKTIEKAIQNALHNFQGQLNKHKGQIEELEQRVSSLEEDNKQLSSQLEEMVAETKRLADKVEDLENRSRRSNLRMVGRYEAVPIAELQRLCERDLPAALGINKDCRVERAHRRAADNPRHLASGSSAEWGCSPGEMRLISWRSLLNVLFLTRCIVSQQPALQLDKYEISLFSEDIILSSVIWLMPPYCLYEAWMLRALDVSVAPRSTSLIEVEVQILGNNETFVVPDRFNVPQCKSMFGEPSPLDLYVFQVGPDLSNQNADQVIRVLPGTTYLIRFMLYNSNKQIAYTNWSQPFMTRDLPPNPREMRFVFEGRSGGMVVITVLLSISMFMLLVSLAVTFTIQK
ncbi:uncharacterized protein LOC142255805 [Anomaloglossus baeobatrachus]|uniref:uncharacterized protein LOC142255805 n=1 Tax=Anomaloglossus baeobatrachus TaxID=238106 RepID=UPI003F50B9B5